MHVRSYPDSKVSFAWASPASEGITPLESGPLGPAVAVRRISQTKTSKAPEADGFSSFGRPHLSSLQVGTFWAGDYSRYADSHRWLAAMAYDNARTALHCHG